MTMINDVSDTSFWVAYYRAKESEHSKPLFKDPFAKKLVGDHGKRIADSMAKTSRYTEWAVVSRTVIIDRLVEKAIAEGVEAIVNLGAGLDTRPYRMKLPANLEWIEADYPNIIRHKSEILSGEVPRCKLSRVEVDLADAEKRKAFFSSVVPQAKKVLIITEGVLPYLSPEQVKDLSNDLREQAHFTFWITEYFHAKVYPYLKNRTRQMQNAPFKFYPDDWFGFFKNLGWVEKETRYTSEIAVEFKRKPPMPWFAKFLFFLMPKERKEQMMKMTGYTVLRRG